MTDYTLEQLIAMNNELLGKAAKQAFSMQFDPFTELGRRTMQRHLAEVKSVGRAQRISPALKTIIGAPSLIIENILDYQDALHRSALQSAS